MQSVIEAQSVVRHLSQNGKEFFTLAADVEVRYDDRVHYRGRQYVVERVEQVDERGATTVRAAYRRKL